MTKDCKEKISWLMTQGTKLDTEIAVKLLDKNYSFKTIENFGKQLNVAISTASRFVKKLGYLSFKHFMYEYNDQYYDDIKKNDVYLSSLTSKASGKTFEDYELESHVSHIGRKLRGRIFVISSKRSEWISKIIIERFKDTKIECFCYDKDSGDLDKWIKQIKTSDSIILITMSGYSDRVEKSLKILATIKEKPLGLIISNNKTINLHGNEFSITTPNVSSTKYNLNVWVEYNIVQLKIISIITILLNTAYIYRKKEIT